MRPASSRTIGAVISRGARWRGLDTTAPLGLTTFSCPLSPAERRACASSVPAVPNFFDQVAASFRPPKPNRNLVRVLAPVKLQEEPEPESKVVAEVPEGDIVEAFSDLNTEAPWMLVRWPLESKVATMSAEAIKYQDGWIDRQNGGPVMELTPFQLGDKVAAKMDLPNHPMVEIMRTIPPWAKHPMSWIPFHWTERPLPKWVAPWLAELYAGKIGGVVQGGKFLVQRPAGAIPERMASTEAELYAPKSWRKRSVKAALLGYAIAIVLGTSLHAWSWCRGVSYERGSKSVPKLIGWYTFATLFVTPVCLIAPMVFTTSQAGATSLILFINMLLYQDMFSE